MADIELVIKMPEEMWERVKEGYVPLGIRKYLMNSAPLPKGHGRLIDAGEYVDVLNNAQIEGLNTYKGLGRAKELLIETHTIIEADKEYEVEVITRGKCMMCGKELTEGLFFCKECGDKANSRK